MKIFFWLLVFCIAVTAPALGAVHRSGNLVEIGAGETIGEDLFTGSRDLRIFGRVDGDVYAGGESLLIEGEVTQDVLVGCRTLRLTGTVGDGLIFFGQDLLIDGEIGGDVKAFGAEVRITPRAVIHGDVFVAAGTLNLEGGLIEGEVHGHVGTAFLNGRINGRTSLNTESIRFGEGYQSEGGTRLTLDEPLDKEQAGHVPADLEVDIKEHRRPSPFFSLFGMLWSIAAALIVGLVLVLFFKQTTRDFLDHAKSRLPQNTCMGFVYLAVIPVAVLILLLLIFTIPLALIVSAVYLMALYVSGVLAALAVGDWLMERLRKERRSRSLVLPLIVGIVVVEIITSIPFIGWLLGLAVVCYGLGSLVNFLWNLRRMPEAGAQA